MVKNEYEMANVSYLPLVTCEKNFRYEKNGRSYVERKTISICDSGLTCDELDLDNIDDCESISIETSLVHCDCSAIKNIMDKLSCISCSGKSIASHAIQSTCNQFCTVEKSYSKPAMCIFNRFVCNL